MKQTWTDKNFTIIFARILIPHSKGYISTFCTSVHRPQLIMAELPESVNLENLEAPPDLELDVIDFSAKTALNSF